MSVDLSGYGQAKASASAPIQVAPKPPSSMFTVDEGGGLILSFRMGDIEKLVTRVGPGGVATSLTVILNGYDSTMTELSPDEAPRFLEWMVQLGCISSDDARMYLAALGVAPSNGGTATGRVLTPEVVDLAATAERSPRRIVDDDLGGGNIAPAADDGWIGYAAISIGDGSVRPLDLIADCGKLLYSTVEKVGSVGVEYKWVIGREAMKKVAEYYLKAMSDPKPYGWRPAFLAGVAVEETDELLRENIIRLMYRRRYTNTPTGLGENANQGAASK